MRSLLLTCSLVAAFCVPMTAFAQLNSGSGGSRMGTSGSSGMGSSGFGSSGFGSSGSSGGFGSSGFGSSGGMGSGGFGSGGMGSTGMGGMGSGGMGQGGMGGQQQGFLGANNNQNQFLGRANTGQQGGMGQNGMMNQFGNNGNRGGNRGNNLNTMNSMFGNNGMSGGMNSRQQPAVRPRQKVAFDYPAPKMEAMPVNLNAQLQRISLRHPGMTNVMVSMEQGGDLVLRGAVKSEADAKRAANLVRLEPGVRTVRNELTFPPSSDSATAE